MADSNILIKLGGSGGNSRQNKISAKKSSIVNKQIVQQANQGNSMNPIKMAGGITSTATGVASGNANPLLNLGSRIPAVSGLFMALATFDGTVQFGANVYKGITGEDMIASNIKAYSKTLATGGMNIVAGSIKNIIFTEPRIRRQNDMRDYGRELYLSTYEKNKLI